MADTSFNLTIDKFYQGFSTAAHLNSLTSLGNTGNAGEMVNIDISTPDYITQGPGLATLTNGTEAGVVDELIVDILETPTADDTTFGISATKLFKISSTTVASGGTPSFPATITDMTGGKSLAYLKGILYIFANRAADSAIITYDLSTGFNYTWATGLVKADLLPTATKEDILLFGHGKYVGTYFSSTDTIDVTKLDFGNNHEVSDICFNANQWFVAVNGGLSGTNRNYSNIYTYEGGATTTLLSDEATVGLQKIGFLFPMGGIIYVAYQDITFTGGYSIGYLSGRKIEPLVSFTGSLPDYRQKTLYKNAILFLSNNLIYSAGATIPEIPFAISQLADGGFATTGALSSPFGTPMIASTESTSFKLAKFSGHTVTSSWKSIVIPIASGKSLGYINKVIVNTDTLKANARCDIILQYNNAVTDSSSLSVTGTGKTRHVFNISKSNVENVRVYINYVNGDTTNDCPVKNIIVNGHSKQR